MGEVHYTCPSCGGENFIASPVRFDTREGKLADNSTATQDDLTCCPRCRSVLKYDSDKWRVITDQEWIDLPVSDRSFLKKVQEAKPKRNKDDKPSLIERLREEVQKHPDIAPALPFLIAARMLAREPSDKKSELIRRGLTHVANEIAKRPETDPMDDVLTLVPVIMAQAYVAHGGDFDAAQTHLREQAEKECLEAGMPESLVGLLRGIL